MGLKTFNFYCDESCHLENDHQSYMLISYVSSAYNQIGLHNATIRQIKEKHQMNAEIKWSKVSHSKYGFYADLIDYFFATELQFRAIVVNKTRINNIAYGQSFDDFYYKMYYQLLHHKIDMEHRYNVYLDVKDTLSAYKVKKLKEILNIRYSSIRNLQNIRSHESLLMQMTDLLMGAISYHLRGGGSVRAKNRLIEKIQGHCSLPLTYSTPREESKFNLFFIDLK
ncbi:DUF3800 domain-containing protein [Larkinella sp. C7]|uniref:DUF3800 domain-containing protein n=1 Tax=Larkinella sp. C7 TaxID=2576607 RepID=UPI001111343E|nr:DUF3800 domain-containing protein [Larkinella sp. C7]